jgi:hypothetical protein
MDFFKVIVLYKQKDVMEKESLFIIKSQLEDVLGLLRQLNIECSEKNIVIMFNSIDKLKGISASLQLEIEKQIESQKEET